MLGVIRTVANPVKMPACGRVIQISYLTNHVMQTHRSCWQGRISAAVHLVNTRSGHWMTPGFAAWSHPALRIFYSIIVSKVVSFPSHCQRGRSNNSFKKLLPMKVISWSLIYRHRRWIHPAERRFRLRLIGFANTVCWKAWMILHSRCSRRTRYATTKTADNSRLPGYSTDKVAMSKNILILPITHYWK